MNAVKVGLHFFCNTMHRRFLETIVRKIYFRVVVLDKVTDFLLLIGKLTITIGIGNFYVTVVVIVESDLFIDSSLPPE